MARGVNKVILVGNLGGNPDITRMNNGNSIANLNLATTESWKDKQSGERKEATEWHRVVFFGKLAEICADYLAKGSQVYVEGSLKTRKWTDKDGHDRYTTEIVGRDMQMLGGKPTANSGPISNSSPETGSTVSDMERVPLSGGDPFSDDIPF